MARHADPLRRRRVVAGVLAWIVFGFAWWLVLRRRPTAWLPELAVPVVTLVVVLALTSLWVRHNVRIYQRKGPRRGVPGADEPWRTDSLGRTLHFAPLATSVSTIRVSVRDGIKHYEVDE